MIRALRAGACDTSKMQTAPTFNAWSQWNMTAVAELPALVPTLSSLAHDANVELAAIDANDADSLQRAIRAGEYLTQAKAKCPKGQWMSWVAENIDSSLGAVTNYRRIFAFRDELSFCRSITQALAWLVEQGHTAYEAGGSHHASTANSALRKAKAVALRQSGMSYDSIGGELGITGGFAWCIVNQDEKNRRAREKRAEDAPRRLAEKKALKEKEQRAAVKRYGGNAEVVYTNILKACEAAGRLAEETPELKVRADDMLADLYRAKDKILNMIGGAS